MKVYYTYTNMVQRTEVVAWAEATEDGKQDCSQYESENTDSYPILTYSYVLLLDKYIQKLPEAKQKDLFYIHET